MEHRLGGIERRRLAGAHDAINVEQRVFTRQVLVNSKRVADIGADIDVIDVEHRDFLVSGLIEGLEHLVGDLGAGFGIDLAGLHVDEVLGDVMADEFLVGHAQRPQALFGELARLAHRNLAAGLDHDLAAVGVDEIIDRLVAAQPIGVEGHPPAVLEALVDDLLVERVEDFLAVHAEGREQRGHRNLAAAVDARIDDVLGVELDVEPGTAIRDDAGGKQELAG